MPITPLHFGLIPLLNRATRRRMSETAFVLANVVADIPVVWQVCAGVFWAPEYASQLHTLHDNFSHHFGGALLLGLGLGVLGFTSLRWWLGSMLGTVTHVALDMLVHPDLQPFMPWVAGNPFYQDGAHALLSIVLFVGLVQWVFAWRNRRAASRRLNQ